MFNEYIEKLNKKIEWKNLNKGQKALVSAYMRSKDDGYDCMVVMDSFSLEAANDFFKDLKAAGITEIYYLSESSNYLGSFVAFQNAGAKIVGMVEIENGKYKMDMNRWGFSDWNQYLPAMKWQIC